MTSSRTLAAAAMVVFFAGAALSAAGCGKMEPRSAPLAVAAAPQALQAGEPAQGGGMAPAERAMRITVETTVSVANIGAASRAVRDLVAQHGGYVGEAKSSGDEDARWASFEVHVPVARLASFRSGVAGLGEIASDAEKAEDVTEQRADIKARLSNARAGEKRLLELLDKRTGSLADVVAVEKELAVVRETVERMEAQERVLEGQIASATVKIQLSTRHAAGRAGPGKRIFHAAGDGIETAGSFLVGIVVVAASAGPTALIIALIGYALFRAVRFLARRSGAKSS